MNFVDTTPASIEFRDFTLEKQNKNDIQTKISMPIR